jgi:hypothetical protein
MIREEKINKFTGNTGTNSSASGFKPPLDFIEFGVLEEKKYIYKDRHLSSKKYTLFQVFAIDLN